MTEKLNALMPAFDDVPELDDDFFERADLYHGSKLIKKGRPKQDTHKQTTTLRLDQDVLAFFKKDGKGYQTRINQALREYMAKHQSLPTQ